MPEYVEYGGLATVPPPLVCSTTHEWGFFAEADPERLTELCRRLFSEPSSGAVDVRPIGRHVVLTWGSIGSVRSEAPGFKEIGRASEDQVAIWIPAECDAGGERRLVMVMPYIWLDNPISLASGREIFGFPKTWGWPLMPAGGASDAFALDAFGMDFGPDQTPQRRPLLELSHRPGGEAGAVASAVWTELRDLAAHFSHLFDRRARSDALRLAEDVGRDLRRGEIRQIFLQQLRAVDGTRAAAFQRINEAVYRIASMRAAPLLGDYELTVHALDSHPLARELGLASQTVALGYRAEIDFTLEPGRVLWTAVP